MANLSISEVAKRWGKGRQTIYNLISDGKLSANKDDKGNFQIDSAEAIRCLGEPKEKTLKTTRDTQDNETIELRQLVEIERLKRTHSEERKEDLQRQVLELKNTIESLKTENTRQGERLETALKTLDKSLDKGLPAPKKPLLEQISSFFNKQ